MPPLVEAKTSRPRTVRATVPRPHLNALLDAAVDRPVTLVCAGAGWGKTIAVSAWAETRPGPVAWLSIDAHDNDAQLFWAYVLAALRVAGAITPDNPLAGLGSVPADDLERGNRLEAGLARLARRTVLVIDDLQEIDDADVLTELSRLLHRLPPVLRLVLVSRGEPVLRLHRLRADGRLAEISTGHLAFTGDEAVHLISGHGLTLDPGEIAELVDRTEGWATGLQLGAAFLAGHSGARLANVSGDLRTVDDYLTEEVLADRTRRQRRFLLRTSICENLCAGLADAITRGNDAQRILEGLERDNDFVIRLGATPRWFRYHHLLRDVLQHRLRLEDPAVVPELHRRAARWHMANNSVIEALTHAAQARDWPYVGRLAVAEAGPLMVSVHRPALVRVLRGVPPGEWDTTPELMVCAALLLFHTGDYDAIPARLDAARARAAARPAAGRAPVEIMSHTLQLAADRIAGDMPAMIDRTGRLLDLLTAAGSAAVAAMAQIRAIALNNRGLALLWTGRLGEAERNLWAGANAARAAGVELAEINATGHLALLQVTAGSVHEAARLAEGAVDLADRRGWRYTLQAVAAHLAQSMVRLAARDLDGAERAVRDGQRGHLSDPEPAQRLVLLGVRGRLATARGAFAEAGALFDETGRDRGPRLAVPGIDRWLALGRAELDLATGRPDRVELRYAGSDDVGPAEQVVLARAAYLRGDRRRAEEILAAAAVDERATVVRVEAGVLGALVADARGHGMRATERLAEAVAVAAREGIRRPFAALAGARLDGLFRRLRLLTPADQPFAAELSDGLRGVTGPAGEAPPDALSERETEVLHYLSTMLTAAEIAQALGLSVNTVKAHMRAIYRKLGAARRTEAVLLARRSGIL